MLRANIFFMANVCYYENSERLFMKDLIIKIVNVDMKKTQIHLKKAKGVGVDIYFRNI